MRKLLIIPESLGRLKVFYDNTLKLNKKLTNPKLHGELGVVAAHIVHMRRQLPGEQMELKRDEQRDARTALFPARPSTCSPFGQ